MRFSKRSLVVIGTLLSLIAGSLAHAQDKQLEAPARYTEVEGISEYRLANGCRVLLYPDDSSQVLTVNMTVLVGSRHEGYGESGMAHLLEHMLFKGTPRHPDVDEELKQRGATDMNGTTSYDRTNFYQTLPATPENLEWAIEMESDRLTNCFIRGEDLASEMTVVRSEFEMGENSPQQILMQRMNAVAYEWHNYGKTIIGSRIDIERVPVNSLRAFYQKHYRPDNVVLIVTGKFDEQQALALANKYFGVIEPPKEMLQPTYTLEPVQDGERRVYLRRAGGAPTFGHVYHIPSASHVDYAPVKVLAAILGSSPNGLLYREFVKGNQASQISADSMEGYDPGVLMIFGLPKEADCPEAQVEELATRVSKLVESQVQQKITEDDFNQAKLALTQEFEDFMLNSKNVAAGLSDWSAYGDWRLFFLTRDRIAAVTLEDVKRVAGEYLCSSNRTTGLFLPTESPQRSVIPATPDVEKVVSGYTSSRASLKVKPEFEATPEEIQKRLETGSLECGTSYALLSKPTRGDLFHLKITLEFGTLENYRSREAINAGAMVGTCMMMGTEKYNQEQIDQLQTKYKAQIGISSEPGVLTVQVEGRQEHLAETLDLLHELLRKPTFPSEEFGLMKSQQLTGVMQMKNDPQMVAQIALDRALSPVDKSHHQYMPTFSEMLSEFRKLQLKEVKQAYGLISSAHSHMTLVGTFDKEVALKKLNDMLSDWKKDDKFVRIESQSLAIKPDMIELKTRDQASAMYMRGANLKAHAMDEDWEALFIAADILGGGSLDSRLARQVREEKGLSYQVGCQFEAGEFDSAGRFMTVATTNPSNKSRLVEAIAETYQQVLDNGFTAEELQSSINSYVKQVESVLSNDAALCEVIGRYQRRGLDFLHLARRLKRVQSLTIQQINAAAQKLLSTPAVTVLAGDFEGEPKGETPK